KWPQKSTNSTLWKLEPDTFVRSNVSMGKEASGGPSYAKIILAAPENAFHIIPQESADIRCRMTILMLFLAMIRRILVSERLPVGLPVTAFSSPA
ncbi:hypothetical protein KI387_032198, partial [Taxus chinensis]